MGLVEFEGRREFESGCDMKAAEEEAEAAADEEWMHVPRGTQGPPASHRTLPIQLLQYIGESPDPSIAAVSTLMIGVTVLVLIAGDRLVGLDRMAGV